MSIYKVADKFEKKLMALSSSPIQRTPLEMAYAIYFAAEKLFKNKDENIEFTGSPKQGPHAGTAIVPGGATTTPNYAATAIVPGAVAPTKDSRTQPSRAMYSQQDADIVNVHKKNMQNYIQQVYNIAKRFYSDAKNYGMNAATHANYINELKPRVEYLNSILIYSTPRLNQIRLANDSLMYYLSNYNANVAIPKQASPKK